MIRQKPNHFAAELSIQAETPSIRFASQWLLEKLCSMGVPDAQIECLTVCLNEVLANIIEHGGKGALLSPISLRLESHLMDHTNKASVSVRDSGVPFNPLQTQHKQMPDTLAEVTPGGLGLTMMRAFVDELRYDYVMNAFNQLSFSIYWNK